MTTRRMDMGKRSVLIGLLLLVVLIAMPTNVRSETLSWNAVTTYTDGSSIGTATVVYQGFWATDLSMTTKHNLGTADAGTSEVFSIDTEGMARGTTVYFSVYATVGGVNSANATPLSWLVPNKVPSAPSNLRVQ
jgi:hypothetical protein